MNVKVVNEAIRIDFRHADDFIIDNRHEWILLRQALSPLTHVLIVRSPSLKQVNVVVPGVRLMRRRKIHFPDGAFLAAIIASNLHSGHAANDPISRRRETGRWGRDEGHRGASAGAAAALHRTASRS